MKSEHRQSPASNGVEFVVSADTAEMVALGRSALERARDLLVERMVDEIMDKHANKIIAELDTKLITNLAVARFVERLAKEKEKA